MTDAPARLLVVKLSSIGDVVHTVPSVAALAAAFPGAPLDWLVEAPAAPIVAALPWVVRTIVSDLPCALRRGPAPLRAELRRLRSLLAEGRYTHVVDLQGLLRSSLLTLLPSGARRVGRGRWPWLHAHVPMYAPATPHAVENTARALGPLGLPPEAAARALPGAGETLARLLAPRGAAAAQRLGLPDGFWLWFPFARWPSKSLPLADAIPEGGVHVVAGGPGDAGRTPARPGVVDACGRLDLLEAGALGLVARRVVAADTGPAHLAALLGANVTVVHGPTRAVRTGPRGASASTLESGCGGCGTRRCARSRRCLVEALGGL